MGKQYQVFIRATSAAAGDIERQVGRAIAAMGHLPVLGTMFPPHDPDGADRAAGGVIGGCDYYLAIVGAEDSADADGPTADAERLAETEYDGALAGDVNVITLVQSDAADARAGGAAPDAGADPAPGALRRKMMASPSVRSWHVADELPGLASLTLARAIRARPAVGWVRADAVASEAALAELVALRRENRSLKKKLDLLRAAAPPPPEAIARLEHPVTIRMRSKPRSHPQWQSWSVSLKWRDVFAAIGPYLFGARRDDWVREAFGTVLGKPNGLTSGQESRPVRWRHEVEEEDFQTIKVQLYALRLVKFTRSRTPKGRVNLTWSLTPRGLQLLPRLRVPPAPVGVAPPPNTKPRPTPSARTRSNLPIPKPVNG